MISNPSPSSTVRGGSGAMASGVKTATINHNVGATPDSAVAILVDDLTQVLFCSTLGATTLVIGRDNTTGAITFRWIAIKE